MIITIDGPVGSGKSSVAKELCKRLGFYYLHTGLLYRAVAYVYTTILNKNLCDVETITPKDVAFIEKISYEYEGQEPQVFFEEENITQNLYSMSLGQQASILSTKREVREKLLVLQRTISRKYNIVADGRDCGSVVFPYAAYKFFLTSDVDVRARRIFEDKRRGNAGLSLQEVKVELEKRDKRDVERAVAPLVVSKDAIIIDNSQMSCKQTLDKFLSYIK